MARRRSGRPPALQRRPDISAQAPEAGATAWAPIVDVIAAEVKLG
jgi:hypothetical protein